jgi:hypothetical protein
VNDDPDCSDWNSASVTEITQPDGLTGSGDGAFGQGTSENDPVPTIVNDSIPPNKSDLIRFGIYQESAGNKTFVAVYWARINSPQGTTNMDFEFNKKQCTESTPPTPPVDADCSSNGVTPIRSVGDKLLLYDLSSGGSVVDIHLRTWDGTQWGSEEELDSTEALGSINYAPIPNNPDESGPDLLALDPLTFGEAIIDFQALLGGANCGQFGSVYLKSRSSDSFQSEIKDFVKPLGVNLSNCTTLTTSATSATIGSAITDTATLSGAVNPNNNITFRVYGPFSNANPLDDVCDATSLASTIAGTAWVAAAGGTFESTASFTPSSAASSLGRYRWTAHFTGDGVNAAAGPTACLDAAEISNLTRASSSVSTAQVLVPNDNATIADGGLGLALNGTATFKLFKPDNPTCSSAGGASAPVALTGSVSGAVAVAVTGNAPQTVGTSNLVNTDTLAGTHAAALGTWHWLVSYTGDSLHTDATASNCIEAFTIDDDVSS